MRDAGPGEMVDTHGARVAPTPVPATAADEPRVGPVRWERTYPPEDSYATMARLEVLGALQRAGARGHALEDARTVAAELVANAIVHAGTPFTVVVDVDSQRLRIAVYDGSARIPRLLGSPPGTWPGFGLQIVGGLATAWGWQRMMSGRSKVVWAELGSTGAAGA